MADSENSPTCYIVELIEYARKWCRARRIILGNVWVTSVEKIWRVMLWICGLSIGVVLLCIEMMSGVIVSSLLAIIGFLTFVAFGDYLIRRNRAEPVPTFVTPMPIVTGNNCTFNPQSSRFCNANRLSFDCFTEEEAESWLKNEPNFTKRIVHSPWRAHRTRMKPKTTDKGQLGRKS